jgi:hypothetical protein
MPIRFRIKVSNAIAESNTIDLRGYKPRRASLRSAKLEVSQVYSIASGDMPNIKYNKTAEMQTPQNIMTGQQYFAIDLSFSIIAPAVSTGFLPA